MTVLQLRAPVEWGRAVQASPDLGALMAEARAAIADLGEALGPEHRGRVEALSDAVAHHAPRVVLVGQVKAGKTALVNALAGLLGLLPTDVNPATAVLTALHLNQPWRDPPVSFSFLGVEDWEALTSGGGRLGEMARRVGREEEALELDGQVRAMRERVEARLGRQFQKLIGGRHNFDHVDAALLRRYVCASDEDEDTRAGRFAEMTKEAAISVEAPSWPVALTLIDTPGVNDPFLVREQRTLAALGEADLCVVVLSAHQAMTTIDLAMLRVLAGLRSGQAIVFVNRVDELADPEAQMPEIASRLSETLGGAGLAREPAIVFGSAMAPDGAPLALGVAGLREAVVARLAAGPAMRPVADAVDEALALCRLAQGRRPGSAAPLDETTLAARLAPLRARCEADLEAGVEGGWLDLRGDLLKMTKEFVVDECARLDAALRGGGRIGAWSVDTTPLRLAMNRSYEAYAASVDREIGAVLAQMADGLAEIRRDLTGEDAAAPEAPRPPVVPAPIPFARMMTVDADLGWWRRLLGRGVRERTEELRATIWTEALALVNEFGTTQVPHLLRDSRRITLGFAELHAAALLDMAGPSDGRARGVPDGLSEEEWRARLAAAEARLATLAARLPSSETPA